MPDEIPVPEWIHEEYKKLYIEIYKKVENTYTDGQPSRNAPFHTPHDFSHSKYVERKAYELLKNSNNKGIEEQQLNLELFLLSSSALIHDIGMCNENEEHTNIREKHHLTSAEYLNENPSGFGFKEATLPNLLKNGSSIESITHTIGLIAYYHRRVTTIGECPEERYLSGICIRTRFLSAILRLADALHVDKSRVEEEKYWLLLLSNKFPLESQFHWIKSFAVSEISVDYQNEIITVQIDIPLNWTKDNGKKSKWEERCVYLENRIRRELESELISIKEVICKYKIPVFHDIIFKRNSIPGYNKKFDNNFLKVLGLIQLIESATAGQAIEVATNLILAYIEEKVENTNEKIDHIYEFVTNTLETTFSEKRHCHVALHNLRDFVKILINKNTGWDGNPAKLSLIGQQKSNNALRELKEALSNFFSRVNREVESKLKMQAGKIIEILNLNKQTILNFLLFAKSRNVSIVVSEIIKQLSENNTKTKIHIYVCENNSKLIYGPYGDIEYSDGIAYIDELVKHEPINRDNISILPDIAITTLLENVSIHAIFFGVNGLDVNECTCAHTAGHLQIVKLANSYAIPTIAIIDSIRIGALKKHTPDDPSFFREQCWFESKGVIKDKFSGIHKWNPREDAFSVQEVTLLVSEKGVLKTKTNNLKKDIYNWADVYKEVQKLKSVARK